MRLSRKRLFGLALGGTLLIQAVLWSSVWLSVRLGDSGGFFAGFGLLVVAALLLGVLERDDLAPALILSIFAALFLGPISSNLMALAWGEHAELGPEGIRGDPAARCLTVVEGACGASCAATRAHRVGRGFLAPVPPWRPCCTRTAGTMPPRASGCW
ncbi:hypothetical protein ACLESO_56720 [Pyxidicoccus sp. 3LG]